MMHSIFGDNFFDDFMDDFPYYDDRDAKKAEKKLYGRRAGNLMQTDIKEKRDCYELEMDLKGFKKEEIRVSLENGCLTISAAKCVDQNEQEKETGKYIRRERFSGACERSFYVGDYLRKEDIAGSFKHGILKLMIPKKDAIPAAEENKYVTIE